MSSDRPLLTIIIPVLNEAATISDIIDRVCDLDLPIQIIVVDDGSTDNTLDILKQYDRCKLTILSHESNQGKGAAIRTAIPEIKGVYTVIQDGDLEYDPQDFKKMLNVIQQENTKVVYGSRIMSRSRMSYLRFWLGGRFVTWVTNILFRSHLTDEPTCYKMFDSDLFRRLDIQSQGFEFCPEVTAKILRMGIPIKEVPISYSPRKIEEGKKIRWKDGLIAIWTLVKYRFGPYSSKD